MPIRFRCPQCDRMLGIARRKAGSQTTCPGCAKVVTVPVQDDRTELDDLDILLNPNAAVNGGVAHKPPPAPPRPAPPVAPRSAPPPAAILLDSVAPAPVPVRPAPAPVHRPQPAAPPKPVAP